jgi:hypothetical protein|tara:strand:- start:1603 stop:1905 length:303 start_codon:yes stop_codon:yes gene_type:complete
MDRQPKKGDLVSYCSSQGDLLGPTHGTLGIVVGGPDNHGKVKVSWTYKSPLHKLFQWFSPESLRLCSSRPCGIEAAPKSYESPVFLEPEDDEKFENDDIF